MTNPCVDVVADHRAHGWLAGLFWLSLAICTWFALVPVPPKIEIQMGDALRHWSAFVWLTIAFRLAFNRSGTVKTAAWLFGYGALLEVLQALGGARIGELRDLLVDVVGIASGLLAFFLVGQPVQRALGRLGRRD